MNKHDFLREHISEGNAFVFNVGTCAFLQRRLLRMSVLREEFERKEPMTFKSVWVALKQLGEVKYHKDMEEGLLRFNKSYFSTTILQGTSKLLQDMTIFPCAFWLPKEKDKPLFFELNNGWFLGIAPLVLIDLSKKKRGKK